MFKNYMTKTFLAQENGFIADGLLECSVREALCSIGVDFLFRVKALLLQLTLAKDLLDL